MIVYSGSKKQFSRDAINGVIAGKVDSLLVKYGIPRASQSILRNVSDWLNLSATSFVGLNTYLSL